MDSARSQSCEKVVIGRGSDSGEASEEGDGAGDDDEDDDDEEEEEGASDDDDDDEVDEDTRRARRRAAMMDDGDESGESSDEEEAAEAKQPTFIRAAKWGGRKPGYHFKQGAKGLGYYLEGAEEEGGGSEGEEDEEDEDDEDEDEEGAGGGGGSRKRAGGGKEDDPDKPESAHARATKRMAQKLTKLEQQALAEKPWQLTGEVGGGKRPVNSLLETDLDFEQGTKIAPVITEEVREMRYI